MKGKTTVEFLQQAKVIHGDRYDYSKTVYLNCKSKVIIICPEHGEFEQLPSNHLVGRICKKCSLKNISINKRKSTKEFIQQAKTVHGNKYDYSQTEYVNYNVKIIIICPEHGEIKQLPTNHLAGNGCYKCGEKVGKKRFTTNDFIIKAQKIHGKKYDYSDTIYNGYRCKLNIRCKQHGNYKQTPSNHLRGRGCSKCSNVYRYSTKEYITECKKNHGDLYDYSKTIYKNASSKVTVICKKHGKFKQIANNHRSGNGCPKCIGLHKTSDEFIAECKKVHGNLYDYSKTVYTKNIDKVTVICKKHGKFEQKASNHRSGHCCPRCKMSKGERNVEKYLIKIGVKYILQHKFKSCVNPKTQYPLKFDFFIPSINMCIEYDGIQHFKPVHFGKKINKTGDMIKHQAMKEFIERKRKDFIKNKYCEDNNIPLVRISYYEDIEEKLDILLKNPSPML